MSGLMVKGRKVHISENCWNWNHSSGEDEVVNTCGNQRSQTLYNDGGRLSLTAGTVKKEMVGCPCC